MILPAEPDSHDPLPTPQAPIAAPTAVGPVADGLRLLHIVEPAAGEGPLRWCHAARFGDHRIVALGVDIPLPSRFIESSSRGISRWIASQAPWRPDAVICWSEGALRAASFGMDFVGRINTVLVTDRAPLPSRSWLAARLLRRALANTIVLAGSPVVAAAWRTLRPSAVREVDIIAPLATPDAASLARRAAIRASLGIADHDVAALLLADPVSEGDARNFLHQFGTLVVGGANVCGIVPAGTGQLHRAARYLRAHHRAWHLHVINAPASHAMPAADLAVWSPEGPSAGGAALATSALAACVPVVAPFSDLACQTLGDAPEGVASGTDHHAFSRAFLAFVDSPSLRKSTGARAAARLADPIRTRAFNTVLLNAARLRPEIHFTSSAADLRLAKAPA